MQPTAPTLLELQRAVRASLVEHDVEAAGHIDADGMNSDHRLDVYRNTFSSVLTSVLRLSYPAVHRLVGPEFFDGAARIFIERHPPQSAYLDDYGGEFPGFLAEFAPAASLPYLPDVARLEWAVNCALHAEDAEPLDANLLAQLGDADRSQVCFVPHQSIRLLRVEYPVDVLWRAVLEQDDTALAAIDLTQGPIWFLVQRLESGVEVGRMSEPAWQLTARLFAGMPLHVALEEMQDVEVSTLLADHLACGRFIDFKLTDTSLF